MATPQPRLALLNTDGSVLSLHDVPRAGEVRAVSTAAGLRALMPDLPQELAEYVIARGRQPVLAVRVGASQDEREQQTIADAVEGVIP